VSIAGPKNFVEFSPFITIIRDRFYGTRASALEVLIFHFKYL
jgi:hypothetical protein